MSSETKCSARTNNGTGAQCTYRISVRFENLCQVHHKKKYKDDPDYKARYDASRAESDRLWREDMEAPVLVDTRSPEEIARVAAVAAARARAEAEAAAEAERQRLARVRADKVTKNARTLAELNEPTVYKLLSYATKLMNLWNRDNIPGMDCAKAYVAIKYKSLSDATMIPHMIQLVKAVATVYLQSAGHHPDHATYMDVPQEERTLALRHLTAALVPYGEINFQRMLPAADSFNVVIQARLRQEEIQRQQREAAAAEQARIEARRAQLARDLRERPVVFQRDNLDGTVNLRAFAADHQSVHRSSVQSTTEKAVKVLMKRPLQEGQETLPEIVADLGDPKKIKISVPGTRERMIAEVTHDYFETEAFSIMYGQVLDRVWAYIRGHKDRFELFIRLGQEIAEGVGQCSNGKMARLVNVLQGFDDTLEVEPPKEVFQNKIALLQHAPLSEREAAARLLFAEHNIPVEEQAAWLEPLLE